MNKNDEKGNVFGCLTGIIIAIIIWVIFIVFHHGFIGFFVAFLVSITVFFILGGMITDSLDKKDERIQEAKEKEKERKREEEKQRAYIISQKFEANSVVNKIAEDIRDVVLQPVNPHIKGFDYVVYVRESEVAFGKKASEDDEDRGFSSRDYSIFKSWRFYEDFSMNSLPDYNYVNGFGCYLKRKLEVLLKSYLTKEIEIYYFYSNYTSAAKCELYFTIPNTKYITPKEW